jgi:hypothetical protein
MIWCRLARKKHQSVDLTTPSRASLVIKQKDPITPENQNRVHMSAGGSTSGVSASQQAPSTPSRAPGVQSPTLPAVGTSLCVVLFYYFFGLLLIAAVDREGDKYLDDDDILSSGQISPLSTLIFSCQLDCFTECISGDYRPGAFKVNINSNRASTTNVSTTNLSAPQALNLQDYEHVLSKLLNKNKKRQTGGKEEEMGVSPERSRTRLHEEGEGEIDSDISEARRNAAQIRKRKEKARFHSLLSVVDWEGVQVEKELKPDGDQDEWDWDWEEWEEGRRKSLFDPRR